MVIYKSKDRTNTRQFDATDFIASIVSHILNMGEQTVKYCGFYSNVCRGILASFIFATAYFGISTTPFITRSIAAVNLNFSVLVALIFSETTTLLIIFLILFERSRLKKYNTKETMTGAKEDAQN